MLEPDAPDIVSVAPLAFGVPIPVPPWPALQDGHPEYLVAMLRAHALDCVIGRISHEHASELRQGILYTQRLKPPTGSGRSRPNAVPTPPMRDCSDVNTGAEGMRVKPFPALTPHVN
ncbi:hypothetical protein OKW35_000949 [Paraburkholderia sp. MM5477-R1]